MKTASRRGGFTLAELLVVMAVIAILVAVAIPTFSASRERAREAVCMANRRSALGQAAYAAMADDGLSAALGDEMSWEAVCDVMAAHGYSVLSADAICPEGGAIALLYKDGAYRVTCTIHADVQGDETPGGGGSDGDSSDGGGSDEGGGAQDVQEWAMNRTYNRGDLCVYEGRTYQCVQGHTSYAPDWTPPQTPALWKPV